MINIFIVVLIINLWKLIDGIGNLWKTVDFNTDLSIRNPNYIDSVFVQLLGLIVLEKIIKCIFL